MTKTLLALPVSPFVMLLIIMIFLLGWPFEWPAIIYLFLPIFMPLILALKFDLVWFGILTAVNLQTAFLSPPVAMSAYYLKAVVPEWELSTIYSGMAQFMVLQVIALVSWLWSFLILPCGSPDGFLADPIRGISITGKDAIRLMLSA